MRVLCVAGARPNFMKVKPVIDALEGRGAETILVHTGQHYDEAMSAVFFADLGLRSPDIDLGVGAGSHADQTARIMAAFDPVLTQQSPDYVVVVGDVNSTMACALVTAKSRAQLAHVEAGLRSGDWAMPEEVNRVVTDAVSDLLLAPSPDAVATLEREHQHGAIHLVGNTMIDSLLANLERAKDQGVLERLGLQPNEYGLVTLHRPSNVDDATTLAGLLGALGQIATELPLVLPTHPRAKEAIEAMGVSKGITLIPPAGYLDFIALEASARLVITDSGGVQEETTALGVACFTARTTTERPITITEGTNTLVGTDPEHIVRAARHALANEQPSPRRPALWDGNAGERIADAILAG